MAFDYSENIYLTGIYEDTVDFDPGPDFDFHTSNGYYDSFLSKLASNGNYIWAKTWGGTEGINWWEDNSQSVVLDMDGNIIITGPFSSSVDFNPGSGEEIRISNGSTDQYILKLNTEGNYVSVVTFGGSDKDWADIIAIDQYDNIFITGFFMNTVDFDPTDGVDNRTSNGGSDIFLAKFTQDVF